MPPFNAKPLITTAGLTSVAVTGLITVLRLLGVLEASELRAYDRFLRQRPNPGMDRRVLVVGLGEDDIQRQEQYPVYDGTLAEALEKLEALEPRAIGVDIGRDVPQGPKAGQEQMRQVVAPSDRIIMACVLSSQDFPGLGPPVYSPVENVAFADFPQDADGVTRRSLLLSAPAPVEGAIVRPHLCNDEFAPELPSLAFVTATMYLEAEGIFPELLDNDDIRLGSARLQALREISGGYAWNGASDYQIMLNYRAAENAVKQVSLSEVLAGNMSPDLVRDRLVLIGYTSPVVKDVVKTPYRSVGSQRGMYGVIAHAQAASQLISAALDGRVLITTWSEPIEIAWIWLWALTAGTWVFYSRHLSWFALGAGMLVMSCGAVAYVLFLQGLWVPLIPCLWAMVLAAAIVGLLDRANRGGYTQAIFAQLQEQLDRKNASASDRQDYLTGLVRRARAVRLQRSGQAIDPDDLATDPLNLKFDSPEMQRIYDAMQAQFEQKAKANRPTALEQSRQRDSKQQRIKRLMEKSQAIREPSSTTSGEII